MFDCCDTFSSHVPFLKGFYDVALRKEAERRAEAEEEYQVTAAATR